MLAWASITVVVVAVLWALRRYQRAWLPVTMALGYYLISCGLLLYSERYDLLGALSVSDERYLADPLAVAVLAVAMVMASRRRGPRTVPLEQHRPSRWRRRGAALLAAALGASLVAGNVTAEMKIGTRPGRHWVESVTTDIDRRQPVELLDTYSPPKVLQQAFFGEEARMSRVLSPLHADLGFGGPAEHLWLVGDDGHLRQIERVRRLPRDAGPRAGLWLRAGRR